ncbi:unnamed protein product [Leptosia nina]|uniref:Uncharacterized protein n=1 Tax=Leptosia nina TaxID=320188 RepID=A0AAV1K077_9NEOP
MKRCSAKINLASLRRRIGRGPRGAWFDANRLSSTVVSSDCGESSTMVPIKVLINFIAFLAVGVSPEHPTCAGVTLPAASEHWLIVSGKIAS